MTSATPTSTIGVFDGDRLAHSWRLAALRERTADELGILVTRLFEQMHVPVASVHGIAVASVVPPLTRPMEEMCERYFSQQALIDRRHQRRHAGALHAGRRRRRRPHRQRRRRVGEVRHAPARVPLIVVDFGTGTTFDVDLERRASTSAA